MRELWRARVSKIIKLRGRNHKLRFLRMIGMGSQLGIKSECADGRGILISRTMRDECVVCYLEGEFALDTRFSHIKSVFTREQLRMKAKILNNRTFAHLAPFKKTAEFGVGAPFLRRLGRKRSAITRFGGPTTTGLKTNVLIPWKSKSMAVRLAFDSLMTTKPS